ncbi:MAG: hypothetical protein OEV49_14710 [candidate division Zixibacteria bacterium]|nr:hypothetical protein [candidate division Zixibacteria bacterium]MDH3937054.1 hypothetical protein [candidate division Zixibacteria bacterium]MDH4032543.1 hypothetical protein [candidate division Zixibacteria bacterium]
MMLTDQSADCRTRTLAGLIMAVIGLCLFLPSPASAGEFDEMQTSVIAMLTSGDEWSALELLATAKERSQSSNEPTWQARFHHLTGLAYQQLADSTQADSLHRQYLLLAMDAYYGATSLLPDYSAALHNLGKVYQELGNQDLAFRYLKQAVESAPAGQPFYSESLAKSYFQVGDSTAGLTYMAMAVAQQPHQQERREQLVSLLQVQDKEAIIRFLEDMLNNGNALSALDLSLKQLADTTWSASIKKRLFGIVVASLSQGALQASLELDKTSQELLARLASDSVLAPAVSVLQDMLRIGNSADVDTTLVEGITRRVSGLDEELQQQFDQLAAWLGETQLRQQKYEAAQQYLELAHATGNQLDRDVLISLSDVYFQTGNTDELRWLAESEASRLYEAKGESYRRGDLPEIYRYHRTLGMMYTLTEKTGLKGSGYATSEFQLSHALKAAQRYNSQVAEGNRIRVDDRVVISLADTYDRNDKPKQAMDLRTEWSENYLDIGDRRAANEVFRTIDVSNVANSGDQSVKKRYRRLKQRRPWETNMDRQRDRFQLQIDELSVEDNGSSIFFGAGDRAKKVALINIVSGDYNLMAGLNKLTTVEDRAARVEIVAGVVNDVIRTSVPSIVNDVKDREAHTLPDRESVIFEAPVSPEEMRYTCIAFTTDQDLVQVEAALADVVNNPSFSRLVDDVDKLVRTSPNYLVEADLAINRYIADQILSGSAKAVDKPIGVYQGTFSRGEAYPQGIMDRHAVEDKSGNLRLRVSTKPVKRPRARRH